ncbi:PREDICTED: uncharacterized protein LOC107604083 [Ficedula albicollis]|uniref:uncharacterized protein LOC107604083 n=1 Tax=Ficedula albicollis TaxID=59894 RepID=UPI0007AD919D|nr:PREDICTED: uncharacterized protein LOC107604083 [Ficedula albicollis]
MDSDLLDLPLGVKIHLKPKSKTVFCRGKLGETLNGPCPSFNLDDPYIHHPAPPVQYNRLHDPHLRDYHKRKDILRMLKRQGVITSDNKVVCTLKEFNEYRNYLTRLKLQLEKILRQQEEGLLPLLAKLKDGPKLPGTSDTSCRRKRRLQPQKPTCPCPQKSKETPLKSGRFRKVKIASDEGQTYSRAKLGTAADSQRKRHNTAHSLFKAVLRQLTAAEAQKLQELVEIIVYKVFVRLKVPRNQRINFLRNAAQGIRGSIFSSCRRTPLDRRQKIEMVAKELLAMVLEGLGYCLEPKASKPRRAVRWKEQPVDGRATLVDKSEEDEDTPRTLYPLHFPHSSTRIPTQDTPASCIPSYSPNIPPYIPCQTTPGPPSAPSRYSQIPLALPQDLPRTTCTWWWRATVPRIPPTEPPGSSPAPPSSGVPPMEDKGAGGWWKTME